MDKRTLWSVVGLWLHEVLKDVFGGFYCMLEMKRLEIMAERKNCAH